MRRRALLVGALLVLANLARAAGPESAAFETSDGFTLKADLWRATDPKAPVAILLHQFNLDRRSFSALVPALQQQGFTVLALDQRGQGESTSQRTPGGDRAVRIQELPRARVGPLVKAGPADVAAALGFLERHGMATDRVVLVGASYGCTVSLLTTERDKRVRAVALLSPGTDYFGVDALPAASAFHGAFFAVAAEDDPVQSAPASARALVAAHDGPERLLIQPTGGHGVALLDTHPELAAQISAFLAQAVAAP